MTIFLKYINMFNFFRRREKRTIIIVPEIESIEVWKEVDYNNPPKGVVLGAFYCQSSGWNIDSVYYDKLNKTWLVTGSYYNTVAPLEYTHWTNIPEPPKL